eukprot:11667826-Alexandrium_andersonii.AAC.1
MRSGEGMSARVCFSAPGALTAFAGACPTRRAPVSSQAPTRSQSAEGSRLSCDPSTPGPAQGPPARGHGGPGGFEHPPIGAPPQ